MDAIVRDFQKNPNETLQKLLKNKFFKDMKINMVFDKDADRTLKFIHLLSYMIEILIEHNNFKLYLKFLNEIIDNNILDHAAKIICASNLGCFEIRIFLGSITTSILRYVPTIQPMHKRIEFIYTIKKLLIDSFHTNHMILCITHLDTLLLRSCNNIKFKNFNLVFDARNFKITDKTPNYVKHWMNPNKIIHVIPMTSLTIYPVIITELQRLHGPMPEDIKYIKKIINNIKISLQKIKRNELIDNVIDTCNDCIKV
jgi:hypothetical protein